MKDNISKNYIDKDNIIKNLNNDAKIYKYDLAKIYLNNLTDKISLNDKLNENMNIIQTLNNHIQRLL